MKNCVIIKRLIYRTAWLLLLGLSSGNLWAQSATLDSLRRQLAQAEAPAEQVQWLNQLAYQTYRRDVVQAKSYAQAALRLSQHHGLTKAGITARINLARCLRLQNQLDSAQLLLETALSLSEPIGYLPGLKDAANNLGATALMRGEVEAATAQFEASLAYARQIPDPTGEANALNNLAVIAEAMGEPNEALTYLEQALRAYQQIPDSAGICRVMVNQAYLYDELEQNDSAISLLFRVLPIQEAMGLRQQEAATRNQLGNLYLEKNLQTEAVAQYRLSYHLSEQIGDAAGSALAQQNLGNVLENQGKLEEAQAAYQAALSWAQQTEDQEMVGTILVNLGQLLLDAPATRQRAAQYFDQALPLLEAADSDVLPGLYNGKALWHETNQQGDSALYYAELSLVSARAWGQLQSEEKALAILQILYRQRGDYARALAYRDTLDLITDSLFNLSSAQNLNQLRTAYQTEKKERENLLLQQDLTQRELEATQQRAQRNLILGITGVVLVLGLAGFGWYRNRQRLRLKEQAFELEQERARQEQRRKEAEKLRELDAMKTRFFTNVSHEFRTPLTLILGQNEQLQRAVSDPQLEPRFEMVDRNGHRLLDLVNQVLDVAKLEAGGMELEPVALDAIPYLKHLLYAFESSAEAKGIALHFDSALDRLDTAFDIKKIERVLFNLLSNAMKFTPAGGEVRLRVQREGSDLVVGVQDSGVGIAASQLSHVFDRFYQADSSSSQPQPGTGIGLSLAKELAELHGGSLRAESAEGQGSTFWLRLPISEEVSAAPAEAPPALTLTPAALPSKEVMAEAAPLATGEEGPTHILVVEDNDDVRSYLRDTLIGFGYRVSEAPDGQAGVQAAQAQVPDLIISDVMMPKLDGFGLAEAIRTDARTSHIPLVLLTSKASDESKIRGFAAGIDEYLLKPFQSDTLQVRLANLIEQRRRLRQTFAEAVTIRPEEVSAVPMDRQFLQTVTATIEANLGEAQFGVEALAEAAGMSVTHLNRKLKALVGQSAGKLIRSMRLQRAADWLQQQVGTVSEIAYDLGFSDPTNFARAFKAQFGVTPSQWREQQAGDTASE